MSATVLKQEERIAFALRALYRQYGYLPYKMNKFEPYDSYAANHDFLLGEGVITFNDTDGRLLALKPDVTLSIIKNGVEQGDKRKVYYHENVYRISADTKRFKEIPQVGVECMGDLDEYDLYESICLAAHSLHAISPSFALDLAHLDILTAVLEEIGDESFQKSALVLLGEKNLHELKRLCEEQGATAEQFTLLKTLSQTYGDMQTVLDKLAPICTKGKIKRAYEEMQNLKNLLSKTPYAERIRFDFSVVSETRYYNGFVFKGFIDGVCESVLAGGQYDRLLQKMGKKARAIGFAVYLDLLENFGGTKRNTDVDALVLYDKSTPTEKIVNAVETLVKEGYTVRAQKTADGLRFEKTVDLREAKND